MPNFWRTKNISEYSEGCAGAYQNATIARLGREESDITSRGRRTLSRLPALFYLVAS